MGFIGIKAAKSDFNAVIAKTIRKYRDISISEIKAIVSEGNYLYECDYIDAQGIEGEGRRCGAAQEAVRDFFG